MLGKERAKGTSERVVRVRAQQREGREQGSAERGERAKGTTLWKERVRFSRERG